ncbi:MAG: NAD(P)-binding domain-containing protein [Pseudomonadales bacterium]|nr:NAD(P)-binding domain-containing protein [Pseudomonadales bacterium]
MGNASDDFHILIIGSGPAGLSAAATANKLGLSYCVLEASEAIAQTLQQFSRGKHVMAEPGFLPLRAEMPFLAASREVVLQQWLDSVAQMQLNIRFNCKVITIAKRDGRFCVTLADGSTLASDNILFCLGQQGNPRSLPIDNSDSRYIRYHLGDARDYAGQHVVVVGAGDSAIENALSLSEACEVSLINRNEDFPKAKPANRSKILRAIKQGLITHYSYSHISALEDADNDCLIHIAHSHDETTVIRCNRVIARLGAISPRRFMQDCGIAFLSKAETSLPQLDENFQSSVFGLFIMGALSGTPLIKQAMNQAHDCIHFLAGKPIKSIEHKLIEQQLYRQKIHVSVETFIHLLQAKNSLFCSLSFLDMREVLLQSELERLMANTGVFESRQFGDELYWVVEGEVALCVDDGASGGEQDKNYTVNRGGFFGDAALLTGQPHGMRATTLTPTLLLKIPGFLLRKLMANHSTIEARVQEVFMLRHISWYLAKDLPSNLLQLFLKDMELMTLDKQQVLLKKGRMADSFYLVRTGALMSDEDSDVRQVFNSGQHVATYETLHSLAMTQTIVASVRSTVIKIPQKILLSLLEISTFFQQQIHHAELQRLMSQQRLQNNQPSAEALNFFIQQGLGGASDVLIINKSLCIGCDLCESACAATHEGNSRLHRKAGTAYQQFHIPSACRHCEHPDCMNDCPSNSLHRMENGEVIIDDTCIGCGNCESNCPYGVINMRAPNPKESALQQWWNTLLGKQSSCASEADDAPARAVKCDLCVGRKSGPACVNACPTGAAQRLKPEQLIDMVEVR